MRSEEFFQSATQAVLNVTTEEAVGTVKKITGLVVKATGLRAPLGANCEIQEAGQTVLAEVVGFDESDILLMPFSSTAGLMPGSQVRLCKHKIRKPVSFEQVLPVSTRSDRFTKKLPVGDELLGRVIDSTGMALDDLGEIARQSLKGLSSPAMNPLKRAPIRQPLDVGVRAINSMLTIGKGQRIGLFAGSGVGKSVLLGMMAKFTKADRVVVGLIGERGREVKEFIEESLGPEGLAKSVVVAAPADQSPLLRIQGADYCTTLAEHFRDQGHNVLLLMDSLTRYAMAQREISLSIGEPPVTKGYPASVFAKLPTLVERAGNAQEGGGSITAFYTVLTEGDDQQDPIADSARAILDGHIVLSRSLADQGHYPAIDIEKSVSRVMQSIVSLAHQEAARILKSKFSKVQNARDLITVGAYSKGADKDLDLAIEIYPHIEHLLQQPMGVQSHWAEAEQMLMNLIPGPFEAFQKRGR